MTIYMRSVSPVLNRASNDRLVGTAGADIMAGGAGNDTYVVNHIGDIVTELAGEGTDTIEASIDFTLSNHVENLLITGSRSGIKGTGNALDNTLTANNAGSILSGAGGNDTLIGGKGNDTLNGGTGVDQMKGGLGDDTYVVLKKFEIGDTITELANQGTDLVVADVNFTLGANLENLLFVYGVSGLIGTGNELNNTLTANNAGNTLLGAGGNDTLIGGKGNDTLDGGTGVDQMKGGLGNDLYRVDYSADVVTELAGEGTDTVEASVTFTLSADVENLLITGSRSGIKGTGNALDNTLTANNAGSILSGAGGNDTLIGGKGNDTLDGGTGVDQMKGGLGNDLYRVDNSADVVTELAGEGIDTVETSVRGIILGANLENLTCIGNDRLSGMGNALNNTLTANNAGNLLVGAEGNDILIGGNGSDSLWGGNGNDTLIGGNGNDTLWGNSGNDVLIGGAGDDMYLLGAGSGLDEIKDEDGTIGNQDVISLAAGVSFDQLQFRRDTWDLQVGIVGTQDVSIIRNWYHGSTYQIERFETVDGNALLPTQLHTHVNALISGMAAFSPLTVAGQTQLQNNHPTVSTQVIASS